MRIFITGGAGFIGSNCADHYLRMGNEVVIFDNLSRFGSASNLDWLRGNHGQNVLFVRGDVRDYEVLSDAIAGSDVVIHLASQVAVTTSVDNPREDFEINALGTFNALEAIRNVCPTAVFLYASSNKIYGALNNVRITESETRYEFLEFIQGIPENFPLDFHSPYGCSKGCGDQYALDYARIYGLRTVSLRQSCIYGERQFGVEDQGWIAHMMIAALQGKSLTIFGDGKQVRDVLHISDLIRAYDKVIERAGEVTGLAINLGGGPPNTLSIWSEFRPLLESLLGTHVQFQFAPERPGDQRVFVSDITRAHSLLDWQPQIGAEDGIHQLFDWIKSHADLFMSS